MNKDAEAIQQILIGLLGDHPVLKTPSGQGVSQSVTQNASQNASQNVYAEQSVEFYVESAASGAADWQLHDLTDPLDSEDFAELSVIVKESEGALFTFSVETISLLTMGERPAVQDRYHNLLKNRLRAEIERRPPLFPWESEEFDPMTEYSDWVIPDFVPVQLWAAQLQKLNLPVPVPGEILSSLFSQCQAVLQTSLREGEKLVKAVEGLFPEQDAALHQLAGLVLMPSMRSGTLLRSPNQTDADVSMPEITIQYETATTAQQMALSLMAAKEILDALTLSVSAAYPQIDRQWQTSKGELRLRVLYQAEAQQLRIQVALPSAGSIKLQGLEAGAMAQRTEAGLVEVTLHRPEVDRTYALEVQLDDADESGLSFAVCFGQ